MKKLFLLAMAFVAVTAFAGCSKDDDAPKINPEKIVGTWQRVSEHTCEIRDGVKKEWDEDLTSYNIIMVYQADGTAQQLQNGEEYPFYYKIEGKIYKESDDKITWGAIGTIIKLTDTEFQLYDILEYPNGDRDTYTNYYIRK